MESESKKKQRARVNKRMRARKAARIMRGAVREIKEYLERQVSLARLRQSYYVGHNYEVHPFTKPLSSPINKLSEEDPYEGEDLMNIDWMDSDDNEGR